MVKILRLLLVFGCLLFLEVGTNAQGYDQERVQLAKFIERMYNNAPFDGCRIVDDYDNSYLLSVVALEDGAVAPSSVFITVISHFVVSK